MKAWREMHARIETAGQPLIHDAKPDTRLRLAHDRVIWTAC